METIANNHKSVTKEETMNKENLGQLDSLVPRHIGPQEHEIQSMLQEIHFPSLQALSEATVPKNIQYKSSLGIGKALTESQCLELLQSYAKQNFLYKNYIGMGYYPCKTPSVIQRNILENPGWYTQYTPYQAEISQGRLEALLNFQTMVMDLTAMDIANSSLLDEGTAAAEAMSFSKSIKGHKKNTYYVSDDLHPQSIEVLKTRAEAIGIKLVIAKLDESVFENQDIFGAILQYPNTTGDINDYSASIQKFKEQDIIVCLACDLLSLALLKAPGEIGADIAIGSSQRFGLGLFNGGPHAAFFASKKEYQRKIPGRIVGVTKDRHGNPALRLALQTREQHIRRDKATSNICTAQVLLAVVASMYAVYHGPKGIRKIAQEVYNLTRLLAFNLKQNAFTVNDSFFDTLQISCDNANAIYQLALDQKINLRKIDDKRLGISLDETCKYSDIVKLLSLFGVTQVQDLSTNFVGIPETLVRSSSYLEHANFNSYHSETEFLRYVNRLQSKDLSLAQAMIPLGSCTMKLNATTEMLPISWPEFTDIHPFAPENQMQGYQRLFTDLEQDLAKITGFDGISLQPNAGSQGEYAGLLAIKSYHQDNNNSPDRNICLIPTSAHGTNPASAVMAGFKVVPIQCDENGNIDIEDLQNKAEKYKENLGALMITYPSTHGVFESQIVEFCNIIHEYGGQVYMDGANMNAQVGLCRPGDYGPDVCHLNLHKTFSIPHGGGGPGVGPIGVKKHLMDYLPGNNTFGMGSPKHMGAISAAPWGSALILNISWAYIKMMGDQGLKLSSQVSILNANYIAKKLKDYFPVLYTDKNGLVAHECIIDTRPLKKSAGIDVSDIAKRLMDYGFHAPTMSWPVIGTLMIEPTESESKAEIDRFCEAMIQIHQEAQDITSGKSDKENNVLKNAPHSALSLSQVEWPFTYSREQAIFPTEWSKQYKFWPAVARVDDAFGDRNLVCSCPGIDEYTET